jgi:S1-C subfamily serine protease
MRTGRILVSLGICGLLASAGCRSVPSASLAGGPAATRDIRLGVVQVLTASIPADYFSPWQTPNHQRSSGSGVVLDGQRILTNAHVVADARFIQVQKELDPRRFEARVEHIGHECDLAILRVDDPAFFEGTRPIPLGEGLPPLKTAVATYGYPMGGDRVSVTEGVVSRVQIDRYVHSMKSSFLVVQTDAAINPGNSGGPVIQDGRVVGIAFQGLSEGENIGYFIPVPIVRHFLTDIADGAFDGFPGFGVYFGSLENEDYRSYLGMSADQTGIVISLVLDDGPAAGILREGDVLTHIDGIPVANDGTVSIVGQEDEGRILFTYLVSSKQMGEPVKVTILRDGKETAATLRAGAVPVRIPWYNEYEAPPRYVVYAGLVFQPLSRSYLQNWKEWWSQADKRMLYYYSYHQVDRQWPERKEYVVLSRVLPHPVNTYVGFAAEKIVLSINGVTVNRLEDVPAALATPVGGFHVIRLEGYEKPVILDAAEADRLHPQILRAFRIEKDKRL